MLFIPICQLPSNSGLRRPAASCEVPAPDGPCGAGARRPRGHWGPGGAGPQGPQVAPKAGLEITNGAMILHGDLSKFGKTKASCTRQTCHFSFGFPKMGFPRFLFKHVWTNLGKRHVLAGKVGFVLQDLDCCRRQ